MQHFRLREEVGEQDLVVRAERIVRRGGREEAALARRSGAFVRGGVPGEDGLDGGLGPETKDPRHRPRAEALGP